MKNLRFFVSLNLLFAVICFFSLAQEVSAQKIDRIQRDQMKDILNNIKKDIAKNYYDTNFHGINLDERFKKAEDRINQVETITQAFAVIAQALIDFDDSHLFFIPPQTNIRVDYGFRMKMIGDKAFVVSVKPKSDAEKQGLKRGDQILMFEGFKPNRKDLWKMDYYYNILSPRTKLRLQIVHPAASAPENIEFDAKITQKKRIINLDDSNDVNDLIRQMDNEQGQKISYFQKVGNTLVWKLPTFSFDPDKVDELAAAATKGSNLIIDLRGDGGGYILNLEKIAGYFFDKDVKIADRQGRDEKEKESKPMLAKSQNKNSFNGKLIVLVDSQSASASEIFARLIQLEKRGTVIGDVSAGAVMQAIRNGGKIGTDRQIFYSTSVTNANVVMSDGKSLEHIGVIPDEIIIPTASDLEKGFDPVLARALELSGVPASPEQAGNLFPDDTWDNQ